VKRDGKFASLYIPKASSVHGPRANRITQRRSIIEPFKMERMRAFFSQQLKYHPIQRSRQEKTNEVENLKYVFKFKIKKLNEKWVGKVVALRVSLWSKLFLTIDIWVSTMI
jgi:hypothetical protein